MWYFSYNQNRENFGPLDLGQAIQLAQQRPDGYAWHEGMASWQHISTIPELQVAATKPPPFAAGAGAGGRADEIDFRIVGNDMQFVEVELDPGESAIAEAGALMYKDAAIAMETIFGDGSSASQNSGLMGKLLSAGKRVLSGETLFTTVFTHTGAGKARVAFASPFPGTVIAARLSEHGGRLICQKDSFLAGAKGVQLGIYLQRKILTGLFGGEGFIMQQLDGDGWVFFHAGGTLVERELAAGERLDVDTGCVVAFHAGVSMDIRPVGGLKSMLFGGEGIFLATLTGPGKVWLQSLPFSRLAGRMLAAAPQGGGERRGEGSILGGLGDLIGGDRKF